MRQAEPVSAHFARNWSQVIASSRAIYEIAQELLFACKGLTFLIQVIKLDRISFTKIVPVRFRFPVIDSYVSIVVLDVVKKHGPHVRRITGEQLRPFASWLVRFQKLVAVRWLDHITPDIREMLRCHSIAHRRPREKDCFRSLAVSQQFSRPGRGTGQEQTSKSYHFDCRYPIGLVQIERIVGID